MSFVFEKSSCDFLTTSVALITTDLEDVAGFHFSLGTLALLLSLVQGDRKMEVSVDLCLRLAFGHSLERSGPVV